MIEEREREIAAPLDLVHLELRLLPFTRYLREYTMDPQSVAHKNFDLNNNIESVSPSFPLSIINRIQSSLTPLTLDNDQVDDIFKYNKQQQQDILKQRPWKTDPHHFKKVRISAVALIKMVTQTSSSSLESTPSLTLIPRDRSCTRDLEVNTKLWD